MSEAIAENTILCPRRSEVVGPFKLPEADHWGSDKTCSFCGGLHPDEALRLLREGAEITPTDKNYKFYINGTRKGYFQHFEEAHKREFIQMLNEGRMNIAYPGHFYVLPFFVTRG